MKKLLTEEQKAKRKAYIKAWRKDHPEKLKQWAKEYKETHKEHLKTYLDSYYTKNKDKIATRNKANREDRLSKSKVYYQAHKEQMKADAAAYAREEQIKNPQKVRERKNAWAKVNPEKIKASYKKAWKNRDVKKTILTRKKWMEENHEQYKKRKREAARARRLKDLNYKIMSVLRSRVTGSIKMIKNPTSRKRERTITLLGCSIEEFKHHIEALWEPGMTWDNYGHSTWVLDHIRPIASFDLTDPKQQRQCFNHKNIQPLWAEENRIKSDKWDGVSRKRNYKIKTGTEINPVPVIELTVELTSLESEQTSSVSCQINSPLPM